MKKTLSLALVMIMAVTGVFAKENQNSADSKTVKGKNISVTYTQPTKKDGKIIFQATELTVSKDCMFGSSKLNLKAGTYSVKTNASGGEWVFVVTKDGKSNGPNSTWARVNHVTTTVPAFTITSNTDGLLMQIDDVNVQVPVEFVN